MTFVKMGDGYWEWDKDRMMLYNYNDGHTYIDENSEEWAAATTCEADSWHDLYVKTGFNPLVIPYYLARDAWLSPEGEFHEGPVHDFWAEKIMEILFGEDGSFDYCSDYLKEQGWVKLTTSVMLNYYIEDGMYDHLTMAQKESMSLWADVYGLSEVFDEALNFAF